jgi:TonB family protein
MNTVFVSGLTILAASMSLLAPTGASAEDSCTPHVVQSETKFPNRSQVRGHEGTVYLNVSVDERGRAQAAELEHSSGYRLLDRAAKQSVIEHWVFDVSSCQRSDLPANHLVAVEYRQNRG